MTRRLAPAEELAALELLEDALDGQPDDPAAYIARADASSAVRDRAGQLLAASQGMTGIRTGAAALPGDVADNRPAPTRIGDYCVIRLLGRGGMGAVYLGERVDADFDHVVAIKLIKPGILSHDMIQRFRRERQIMAKLRHPHIAQLYDGGEADDGSPYIVMEHVDGVSLAHWLEQARPDLDRRLALMLQICDAVEFAHQNLIIHRDLTPGNVLVNARGDAKLIDFGIARPPVDRDAPQAGSALSKLSLTPGFAAPERATEGAVTTLVDVYALGRILLRMIDDIRQPELEAIAHKASDDAPERRHASAALLAADISAFRAGHPVAAYSDKPAYRLGKYVRRHRLPVALAGLAAFLLVGGLAGMTLAYRDAEQARAEAERRFTQVRELSNFMLFDLYDALEHVPGTTKAMNDIADRARHYLDVLSRTRGAPTALRLEAAVAYKRLADVLGTPSGANLGRREEAGEALSIAVAQMRALLADHPGDPAIVTGLAEALHSQALFDFIAGDRSAEAHASGEEAATLFQSLASTGDRERYAGKAIDARIDAAAPLSWIDRGEEAAGRLRQIRSDVDRHIATYGRTPDNLKRLAHVQATAAEVLGRLADAGKGDYAAALPDADGAIRAYDAYLLVADKKDGARRSLAIALLKRSLILYSLERDRAALADLDRAEQIAREQIGRDPRDDGLVRILNSILEQKAITLAYLGRKDHAVRTAQESLGAKRQRAQALPQDRGVQREYAGNLLLVGRVFEIVGDRRGACRLYREAQALFGTLDRQRPLADYDRQVVTRDIAAFIARTC
ncbi:protein kinase domain-containing protein [Sphingomonas flavalba]|uniref:serine/threonine-protein kinase n=1 Tax=Sphingomonas flavalba TaxID=2559804 RepID=UPI0039DFE8A0